MAVTDYKEIRAYILNLLGQITEVGVLHDRVRWGASWEDLYNLFTTTLSDDRKQIRTWMLSRVTILADPEASSYGHVMRNHMMVLVGILGFNDEGDSDGEFQALIDKVIDKLDTDSNLGGATNVLQSPGFANVRVAELRYFGSVLCHYCEIEFNVPTEDTVANP